MTAHARTGCEFRHLGGSEQVVYVNGARLRIVNSTLAENTITDDSSSLIYTYFTDGAAWLQGVALVNNSVALPLEAGYNSDGFASDVPRDYYDSTDMAFVSAPARPAEANAFLGGNEAWFQDVLKVCPPPGRAPAADTRSVCCCLHAAAKAFFGAVGSSQTCLHISVSMLCSQTRHCLIPVLAGALASRYATAASNPYIARVCPPLGAPAGVAWAVKWHRA